MDSDTGSLITPPSEFVDLSANQKLARLKSLIDKSRIYADILTQSIKTTTEAEPEIDTGSNGPKSKSKSKSKSKRKTDRAKAKDNQANVLEALSLTAKTSEPSKTSTSFAQPTLVNGTLHDYQLVGVEWLASLYQNGLNGILADEMGLGKTVQALAFLAYLVEHNTQGPFLVVAPLSTLANWVSEVQQFVPSLSVVKYHGSKEARAAVRQSKLMREALQPGHKPVATIVCTTYEMVIRDGAHLERYPWKYVVIDEGHRLKNMDCQLVGALKRFDSNRLLMTGTPLQNNLAELWSLLNFVLPDVFTDLELFQAWFESGQGQVDAESQSDMVQNLHEILRPFLLRRVKAEVRLDLPPKREYVLYCPLSAEQIDLYESLLQRRGRNFVVNQILKARGYPPVDFERSIEQPMKRRRVQSYNEDDDEYFTRILDTDRDEERDKDKTAEYIPDQYASILRNMDDETRKMMAYALRVSGQKSLDNVLMQLRLACNTPHLFYYPWAEDEAIDRRMLEASAKLQQLDELCARLIDRGHKVLVFSQFTKMVDIMEDWLQNLRPQWQYARIDGSMAQEDRQANIADFSAKSALKLFLLTTRSGGLGINLTAADSVIIYDSDWNPQQDLQAMARVHRIGQTKPVVVYRLATRNSVEGILLDRAKSKRSLEQLVIEHGDFKGLHQASRRRKLDSDVLESAFTATDFAFKSFRDSYRRGDVESPQWISDHDYEILLDRSEESFAGHGQFESEYIELQD